MYYEINVSRNGRHFFATAPRSVTSEGELRAVFTELKNRFPEADGFEVTATRWETVGHPVHRIPLEGK